MWFDPDVNRINYDERGNYLGEFKDPETILVMLKNGEYYLTNFDTSNHYDDNIMHIEKYDERKVWTAIYRDADKDNQLYVKRMVLNASKRRQRFIGDNPKSVITLLSDKAYPRILVKFGGEDAAQEDLIIDINEFVKFYKYQSGAKRVSAYEIASIEELEPTHYPEPDGEDPEEEEESKTGEQESKANMDMAMAEEKDPDTGKTRKHIIDEKTGQLDLFGSDV